MSEKVPARRPDGRSAPPRGCPDDPTQYADPANWRYPLHTPQHVEAAVMHFARPANRELYDPKEQAYIERCIAEAQARFSQKKEPRSSRQTKAPPEAGQLAFDTVAQLTVPELLLEFTDTDRLRRARQLEVADIDLTKTDEGSRHGTVGTYHVTIDPDRRTIIHDCPDWHRQAPRGKLCKHLGAVFLTMDDATACGLLEDMKNHEWKLRRP